MAQPDFSARNKLDVLVHARKDALSIRWMAATAVIAVYALLLAAFGRVVPDELPWAVKVPCWLAGAVLAVLAVVLPRRGLTDKALKRHLELPMEHDVLSARMKLDSEQSGMLAELPDTERSAFGLILLFGKQQTLGLALSGALALVGLGFGLASRSLLEATPFLLAALALNCWHFPRLAGLVDRGLKLAGLDDDAMAREALAQIKERERRRSQPPPSPQRPSSPPPASLAPAPRPGPRLRKR